MPCIDAASPTQNEHVEACGLDVDRERMTAERQARVAPRCVARVALGGACRAVWRVSRCVARVMSNKSPALGGAFWLPGRLAGGRRLHLLLLGRDSLLLVRRGLRHAGMAHALVHEVAAGE